MDRDLLYEQYLDYEYLKEQYRNGKLQGLNHYERDLLEFCHNRDMREYLRENVWDKPIVLNDDGGINWNRTKFRREEPQQRRILSEEDYHPQQYVPQHTTHSQQCIQPTTPPQMSAAQVSEQRFYYLYDDEGNLIAALPKK